MPKINADGEAIVRRFEGCMLSAYFDADDVLTVGYGHTGPDVVPGLVITQDQAEHLLDEDLCRFEAGVNGLCSRSLTSNQFSALVSFAYNEGLGALGDSTLMHLVNAGNYAAAADQFRFWVYGNGVVLPGLVRRRQAERDLFLLKEGQ